MTVRPSKLDEIIGQTQVKTVCKTLVSASKIDGKPVDHILFSGISGGGKTTVARAVAYERGVELHQTNASTIKNEKQLHAILHGMDANDIFFIDEIHALSKKVSESIYTIIEDFFHFDSRGRKVKVKPFTLLGASTEIGRMPGPLKNRFKFIAEFVPYTEDELKEIVHMVCKAYKFKLSESAAETIARTCRGTPRIVVNRTEWIRNYLIANDKKSLKTEEIIEVIALQGVNKDGLERQHVEYLKELSHGTIGMNQLSSRLSLDAETLANDIEPYLIQLGLVEITKSGRDLTTKGIEYVERLPE